jgi:hypothetical protein
VDEKLRKDRIVRARVTADVERRATRAAQALGIPLGVFIADAVTVLAETPIANLVASGVASRVAAKSARTASTAENDKRHRRKNVASGVASRVAANEAPASEDGQDDRAWPRGMSLAARPLLGELERASAGRFRVMAQGQTKEMIIGCNKRAEEYPELADWTALGEWLQHGPYAWRSESQQVREDWLMGGKFATAMDMAKDWARRGKPRSVSTRAQPGRVLPVAPPPPSAYIQPVEDPAAAFLRKQKE